MIGTQICQHHVVEMKLTVVIMVAYFTFTFSHNNMFLEPVSELPRN